MQKNPEPLEKLEEAIGYVFRDRSLLLLALTHSSYANEHRREHIGYNERIEFLGDAVLETVSSEYLYSKYPDMDEGDLSKTRASMVCEPTLALCAHDFSLSAYLYLGKGEDKNGGRYRDSIVSDAVEALIGAIYLDGGFEDARSFIQRCILNDIDRKKLFTDSKTKLQEIVQAEGGTVTYVLVKEEGPDHDKHFTVEAQLAGKPIGCGMGHTKKAAEQHAAYEAIQNYKG